jgi:tetratricopeptide (TPR) repeat protein
VQRLIRWAAPALVMLCAIAGAGQQQKHARPKQAAEDAPLPAESNPLAEIIRENNFGVSLMNRQQFEKALEKFTRACVLNPDSETGCLNMGIALLNMQKFEDARRILEKAAQRDTQNPRPSRISKRPRSLILRTQTPNIFSGCSNPSNDTMTKPSPLSKRH